MDHNIGTGLIVGLAIASSIYIWNSENFNSSQKTILLICIIFPPAQWLGIFIVLIYNNYIENNSVEKVTERKIEQTKTNLNSSISNLTQLKEKGILTEEEYITKIKKIEVEKTEQNLKNSTEYKQLKSLLDSGILSKEEFGKKVVLLYNNEILKSPIKTEFKKEEKKIKYSSEGANDFNYIYIVLGIVVIIIFLGIFTKKFNNSNNFEEDKIFTDSTSLEITDSSAVSYSNSPQINEVEDNSITDSSAVIYSDSASATYSGSSEPVSSNSNNFYKIATPRSYFYSESNFSNKTNDFLIKGDSFFVTAENNDFYYITFLNNKTGITTRGWIYKYDVAD